MKIFKINYLKKEFAMLSVFVLLTVAFNAMLNVVGGDYYGTPPPENNDWIIHNETYVGNETILMNGDVIIGETGKLTLFNCILRMNCSSNGDYKIQVNNSGILNLYYSTITNGTSNANYDFYFLEGSNGDIQYSTIEKCGYSSGGSKGLSIESNNVSVYESILQNNYNGIYANKASPLIINSTIIDNTQFGIYWDSGDQVFNDDFNDYSKINYYNKIQIKEGDACLDYNEYFGDENTTALVHMNDGNGNTATDSSGNGNDGSITGASWSTDSRFGSHALSFDGNDDYIDFGDVFDLSTGSIEMWFNLSNNFDSGSSSDMTLFSKYKTQGPKEYSVKLKFESDDGKIHFIIINDADSKDIYSDSSSWGSNVWYHVAATWGSSGMKMYINNSIQADTDVYTGFWGDKNSDAHVGILYDGSSYLEDFDGIIDEFRVSQVARTKFIGFTTSGYLISEPIYSDTFIKWEVLNISKTEPDGNHYIRVDILNGDTDEVIEGFENLFGTEIDISSIQWYNYSSLKLKAYFNGDGNKTPELDSWHLEGTTTIYNNIIQNNYIGIYLNNTSPIISNNIIKNTTTIGIKVMNASPQIERNDISSTDKNGDGIHFENSYPILLNNTIHHCNNGIIIKDSPSFEDAISITNNTSPDKNPDQDLTFKKGSPSTYTEEKTTYIQVPNSKYSTIKNATLQLQGFLDENYKGIGWGVSDAKISENPTIGRTAIATEGDKIYVVWEENSNIYFNKYNGNTWGSINDRVNNNIDTANSPSIAVENNIVYVIWEDDRNGDFDIYFNKYSSGSWGNTDIRVNTDIGTADQLEPAVAADNGYVYAVWEDNRNGVNDYDIYFNVYDSGFWNPSDNKISNDLGTYFQCSPSIATETDNIYVVWEDNRSGNYDIYFNMYDGSIWGDTDIEVSNDPGSNDQTQPSIAIEEPKRYVVWQDDRNGDLDIYFNKYESGDWGETDIKISNDDRNYAQKTSSASSIAVNNGNISVVWYDYRNDQGDIYFNTYNGSNWDTTDFKINKEGGTQGYVQKYPSIAMANNDTFIVWTDIGNGTYFNDYRSNETRLIKAYPTNPYLDAGNDGDIQWSHSGIFDNTEKETTEDITSELTSYLQKLGSDPNEFVSVPLVFHSDTGGGLHITNIVIVYDLDLPIMAYNEISNCNISLYLKNIANFITYQNIFNSNNISIKCDNSSVMFEGSEILNSVFYDFYLIEESNSTLLNTAYDEDKLFINDTSNIIVNWYLHVRLIDANGNPLGAKIISVTSEFGPLIYAQYTSPEGWAKWFICTEVAINKSDRLYHTPHIITSDGGNNVNVVMHKNQIITLYYGNNSDVDYKPDSDEVNNNTLWFNAGDYAKYNEQVSGNSVVHYDESYDIINDFVPTNGNGSYKYYIRARTNMGTYITDVDTSNPTLFDISWHPDGDYALVVGDSGVVGKLENGSLTEISTHTAGCLYGVDWKPDGSEALMVGWNMTYELENPAAKSVILKYNGTTITEIEHTSHDDDPLYNVAWHPTSNYAIIVGGNGKILKYTSGSPGIVSSVASGVTEDLHGISWKPNGGYALIVGEDGKALKYNHPGGSVNTLSTGTPISLYGVSWTNDTEALIVGDEGKVLKYDETSFTDIGQSETKRNLRDVCYNSLDNETVMAGENGTVVVYNGTIFNRVPSPTSNYYNAIAWKPETYSTLIVGSGTYDNQIIEPVNNTYGIIKRYFVPRINLSVNDSGMFLVNDDFHELNSEYRWYSTPEFTTGSDYLRILACDLEKNWDSVEVDKLMLARLKNSTGNKTDIKPGQITNPLDSDTDKDGIEDGLEIRNETYWWEAEDFCYYNNTQVKDDVLASNAKSIISINETINETINISADLSNNGDYEYYVKAKKIQHIYDDFTNNNVGNNGDQLWTIEGDYDVNDGNLIVSYSDSPGEAQQVLTQLRTTKKYTTSSNWELDYKVDEIITHFSHSGPNYYGISIFLTDGTNTEEYVMGYLSTADDPFQEIENWYSIRVECDGSYARFYRKEINGSHLLRKIVELDDFNGIYFGMKVIFYFTGGGVTEGITVLFDNAKVSDGKMELYFDSSSIGTYVLSEQYEWYSKEISVPYSTGIHNLYARDISVDIPSIYIDKVMLVNTSEMYISTFSDNTQSKDITFPGGGGYNNSINFSIPKNAIVTTATFELNGTSKHIALVENNSEQQKPAIYENKIIWQDYRNGNWDIYMYDLGPDSIYNTSDDGNDGNVTQITTNAYHQINASIWGDRIVYEDNRNTGIAKWDIYAYNLSTQSESIICNNANNQVNPDIYGDKIVWQDDRNYGSNGWDIYMYNLTESQEIPINIVSADQMTPSIYENRIVWADYRDEGTGNNWDIYMCDLSYSAELYNGDDLRITSTDTNYYRQNPKIHGDKVIWEEAKNEGGDVLTFYIYIYDFSEGKESVGAKPWLMRASDLYGDKIVWSRLGSGYEQNLYIDDLSSEKELIIDTDIDYVEYPTIYKDKIVWQCEWQNSNISILDQFYTLDVTDDGDIEWNHTEVFTIPETTINLAEEINDYLADATDDDSDGYIEVPLNFTSAYSGVLNISNINIYIEFLTDPLDQDTDGDLIYDGGEVYGFFGIDILEAEDAVDIKEWKNPVADLNEMFYDVPVVNFIYQTGVTLTASLNHTFIDTDDSIVGEESRDSWITLRTDIDTTQQYKLLITPLLQKTVMDIVTIHTEDGWKTRKLVGGTVEYKEIAVYANYTIYDYLRKVVANATYLVVERVGGGIIEPVSGSVDERPNVIETITGATLEGIPTNKASVMASMHYSAIYNFTQDTNYKITIGIDLTLIPDSLKSGGNECPENLDWDEISLIRIVDLDNIRVERMALNPLCIDTDQDLLTDGFEHRIGGYPLNPDADGDGLNDWLEIIVEGTNPLYRDTDYDGIRDAVELGWTQGNISITLGETDSPGSWMERTAHWETPYDYTRINNFDADPTTTTNPFDTDTDEDGLPDGWTDGWIYEPLTISYPLDEEETNKDLGYWRYYQEYWKDSGEIDNIIQIYEGEDLNLDGSNIGVNNWGFDPIVFNRTKYMSGETDATLNDTDDDSMVDGYEVWYSHIEPIFNETGVYILDPTNPNDADFDYDPAGKNATVGNAGGTSLFALNENTVARAQRVNATDYKGTNITKVAVHINSSVRMRLEIWDTKSGPPEPKDCLFIQDQYDESEDQDWYIFDIPDALINTTISVYYFIVMRFMSDEYSWYGKQDCGYTGETYYQNSNGAWTIDSPENKLDFILHIYDFENAGDNLTNVNEYIVGTNPKNKNSDKIIINGKIFDDKLIDGEEVGFFQDGPQRKVVFRTNVKDGAIKFDNYGKNDAYKQWVYFAGNGDNAGYYGYVYTLFDPPSDYSEVDDDNIRIDKLYDNTIIVFDTDDDLVYVWSPNSMQDPDENGISRGTCHVFSSDSAHQGIDDSKLPNTAYRNQERYFIDPCTYDTDRDNRIDHGNIRIDDCEAPDWYADPDNDGLVNAKDVDSDNDGVFDNEEIWKRYVNGNYELVGDIDNDNKEYCAIDTDSDGDMIPDGIEFNKLQGKLDTDGDGWQNMIDPDLDGDGLPDGWIDGWEYDPYTMNGTINSSKINSLKDPGEYEDKDYDGINDTDETDPMKLDTDNDGLYDGYTLPSDALSLHPQLNQSYSWFVNYMPSNRIGELNATTNNKNSDTDGDNLIDGKEVYGWYIWIESRAQVPSNWEIFYQRPMNGTLKREHVTSNPKSSADSDGDGLYDDQEYAYSNTSNNDTDNDGLDDGQENSFGTSPVDRDTDDDLAVDGEEYTNGTSAINDIDSDGDGLMDGIEFHYHANASNSDSDSDGLNDIEEYRIILRCKDLIGVNPDYNADGTDGNNFNDNDSDDDGLFDDEDVNQGGDLKDSSDYDLDEVPNNIDSDSDNDGTPDGVDPYPLGLNWDQDEDGLNDSFEPLFQLNNITNDTDGDGIEDADEYFRLDNDDDGYYNGNDTDSDNDGLPDGWIDGWGFKEDDVGNDDPKSIPGWGIHYSTGDRDGDGDNIDPGEYEDKNLNGECDSDLGETLSQMNLTGLTESDIQSLIDADGDSIPDGNETAVGQNQENSAIFDPFDPADEDSHQFGSLINIKNKIDNLKNKKIEDLIPKDSESKNLSIELTLTHYYRTDGTVYKSYDITDHRLNEPIPLDLDLDGANEGQSGYTPDDPLNGGRDSTVWCVFIEDDDLKYNFNKLVDQMNDIGKSYYKLDHINAYGFNLYVDADPNNAPDGNIKSDYIIGLTCKIVDDSSYNYDNFSWGFKADKTPFDSSNNLKGESFFTAIAPKPGAAELDEEEVLWSMECSSRMVNNLTLVLNHNNTSLEVGADYLCGEYRANYKYTKNKTIAVYEVIEEQGISSRQIYFKFDLNTTNNSWWDIYEMGFRACDDDVYIMPDYVWIEINGVEGKDIGVNNGVQLNWEIVNEDDFPFDKLPTMFVSFPDVQYLEIDGIPEKGEIVMSSEIHSRAQYVNLNFKNTHPWSGGQYKYYYQYVKEFRISFEGNSGIGIIKKAAKSEFKLKMPFDEFDCGFEYDDTDGGRTARLPNEKLQLVLWLDANADNNIRPRFLYGTERGGQDAYIKVTNIDDDEECITVLFDSPMMRLDDGTLLLDLDGVSEITIGRNYVGGFVSLRLKYAVHLDIYVPNVEYTTYGLKGYSHIGLYMDVKTYSIGPDFLTGKCKYFEILTHWYDSTIEVMTIFENKCIFTLNIYDVTETIIEPIFQIKGVNAQHIYAVIGQKEDLIYPYYKYERTTDFSLWAHAYLGGYASIRSLAAKLLFTEQHNPEGNIIELKSYRSGEIKYEFYDGGKLKDAVETLDKISLAIDIILTAFTFGTSNVLLVGVKTAVKEGVKAGVKMALKQVVINFAKTWWKYPIDITKKIIEMEIQEYLGDLSDLDNILSPQYIWKVKAKPQSFPVPFDVMSFFSKNQRKDMQGGSVLFEDILDAIRENPVTNFWLDLQIGASYFLKQRPIITSNPLDIWGYYIKDEV